MKAIAALEKFSRGVAIKIENYSDSFLRYHKQHRKEGKMIEEKVNIKPGIMEVVVAEKKWGAYGTAGTVSWIIEKDLDGVRSGSGSESGSGF